MSNTMCKDCCQPVDNHKSWCESHREELAEARGYQKAVAEIVEWFAEQTKDDLSPCGVAEIIRNTFGAKS